SDATTTQTLVDSGKLLTDTFHTLSVHRKFQLHKSLSNKCQQIALSQNVDAYLFGSDFAEKCRSAKDVETAAMELLKPPAVPSASSSKTFKLPAAIVQEENETERKKEGGAINFISQMERPSGGIQQDTRVFHQEQQLAQIPLGEAPSFVEEPYPQCISTLRLAHKSRGVPETAINTLISSLAENTIKQYNITYKKWWGFCGGKNVFTTDSNRLIEFLNSEFEKGSNYNTLNQHRSAINTLLQSTDHPSVTRFMKGVFRLRSVFPKYNETWNPNPVLDYF
ncbi:unnamed protein product, partial [Callosobruchus maculatus]